MPDRGARTHARGPGRCFALFNCSVGPHELLKTDAVLSLARWPTLQLDGLARAGNDSECRCGEDSADRDLDREAKTVF